jgi:type I restriction enzyme M protein
LAWQSRNPTSIQDIGAHLHGGIPARDVEALAAYWKVCPALRAALFANLRPGYLQIKAPAAELRARVTAHPQFAAFIAGLTSHFQTWRDSAAVNLRKLKRDCLPKAVIHELSERLLAHAESQPLIDPYAVYQHLMDYWAATMQDDCYLIAADGWVAKTARIVEADKKGKTRDKGWTCDLVPKPLIVARYFATEQAAIETQQTTLETTTASLTELEEEQGGEEGFLGSLDKLAKAEVSARLKEIKGDKDAKEEAAVLTQWLKLNTDETDLKKAIREAEAALDKLAYEKYPKLTEAEIKTLVVDDKWLTSIAGAIQGELDRVSQTLTSRIRLLADRYASTLPEIVTEVAALAARVDQHLMKMGCHT